MDNQFKKLIKRGVLDGGIVVLFLLLIEKVIRCITSIPRTVEIITLLCLIASFSFYMIWVVYDAKSTLRIYEEKEQEKDKK